MMSCIRYLQYNAEKMSMRKLIRLGFIAMVCMPLSLMGQDNAKTDSLLKALSLAKKDTSKVLLLYTIAEQYENSVPEKAKNILPWEVS